MEVFLHQRGQFLPIVFQVIQNPRHCRLHRFVARAPLLQCVLASGDSCAVVDAAITPNQISWNFFRIRDRFGRAMQVVE